MSKSLSLAVFRLSMKPWRRWSSLSAGVWPAAGGTFTDLRWMVAYYGYGCLPYLALPLWPVGLLVDGGPALKVRGVPRNAKVKPV